MTPKPNNSDAENKAAEEAKAKAEADKKAAEDNAAEEAKARAEADKKAAADKNGGKGYQVLDTIRAAGEYYYEGDTLPPDAVSKKAATQLRKRGCIK